ncbi:hypothetical protein PanWU01x14_360680 [Parasponia andersonii]|uniref:Uncharacterized protein n=1 Tax=Parasponia andersonii TaxID=3476 RepID=A0A2P5A7I9_PARAD|nr:hypothetical protein PanWU01x14_360680 [Parasponia andersonii]
MLPRNYSIPEILSGPWDPWTKTEDRLANSWRKSREHDNAIVILDTAGIRNIAVVGYTWKEFVI